MKDWLKKLEKKLCYSEEWRESRGAFGNTAYRSGPMKVEKRAWFAIATESPAVFAVALFSTLLCLIGVLLNWPQIVQRTGAVMIISGVLMEYSGAMTTRKRMRDARESAVVRAAEAAADRRIGRAFEGAYESGAVNTRLSASTFIADPARVLDDANRNAETKERPFIRLEVALVVFGTLFTCVGDWLTCSIHVWGFSTCSS